MIWSDILADDAAQPDRAVSTNVAAVSTRGVLKKTDASKRTSFAPEVTERPFESSDVPVAAVDSSADQAVAVADTDTTAAVSYERAPPSRTRTKSSDKTPRQRTPLHTRADQGDTCMNLTLHDSKQSIPATKSLCAALTVQASLPESRAQLCASPSPLPWLILWLSSANKMSLMF